MQKTADARHSCGTFSVPRKLFAERIKTMKKTTNYELNQWDPSDRVLRTDFNSDNSKIDAAIQALSQRIETVAAANRVVKLLETTTTEGKKQIDIDIGALHPEQYRELWLNAHFSFGTSRPYVGIKFNNGAATLYGRTSATSATTDYSFSDLRFLLHDSAIYTLYAYGVLSSSTSSDFGGGYVDSGASLVKISPAQWTTLSFYGVNGITDDGLDTILAGAWICLYGLKK